MSVLAVMYSMSLCLHVPFQEGEDGENTGEGSERARNGSSEGKDDAALSGKPRNRKCFNLFFQHTHALESRVSYSISLLVFLKSGGVL